MIKCKNKICRNYINFNAARGASKFIFQVGSGGGYCAEMGHLLKRIHACLFNDVQFCLGQVRNPRGYAVSSGWTDYFEPVFPEVQGSVLSSLNRSHFPLNRIPVFRFASKSILKFLCGQYLYMFDEIPGGYPEEVLVKKIGVSNDYWIGTSQLITALWQYRSDVEDRIGGYRDRFSGMVNGDYVAVHVRRGDKITESPYVDLEKYVEMMDQHGLIGMPIFLATDDIRVRKDFKDILGNNIDIRFFDGVQQAGYDQTCFNSMDKARRWQDTVMFMFELDMMRDASFFVGASPSNVFYWTRYRRGNQNMLDIGASD